MNHSLKRLIEQEEGSVSLDDQQTEEEEAIPETSWKIKHNPSDSECVCDTCCEQDYWDKVDKEIEDNLIDDLESAYWEQRHDWDEEDARLRISICDRWQYLNDRYQSFMEPRFAFHLHGQRYGNPGANTFSPWWAWQEDRLLRSGWL